METITTTSQKFYAVANTFVSVARHGSRWGCYMELEDGTMSWIGEWSPTKATAIDYAQQQYALPAKLVADALFARQAARDARKIQEDYYTAPGFNHARYAELVDAKKMADSEWSRAMDRVDAHSEAADLYQEAVNPPPAPTPGAPLAAPTATICANGVPVLSVDRAQFEDTARAVRQQPATCQRCYFVAPQHASGCVNTDKPRCPDCGHYWCSGCANLWPDPQPTPALPAYNPEDGAPCAQCGHGQELHYEGVGECWESSDTTPPVGCPCPQFQAREAAQRADEAELQAGLLATLPPMAGGAPTCFYCEHHGDGVVPATRQIAFVDNDAPRAEWVCDACARAYFPAAQLAPPPMAGGGITYQLWKHDTSGDVYVVAIENYGTIVSAAGPLDHSTYAQALAGDFDDDHELRDDLIANNGFYTVYQPPIAGGAPSHYDDPAWLADEAWALQEERNAESARTYRCPACAHSYPTDDAMMACFDSHVPEHPHCCPTCHQARPCTGTGCADGPRECNTCSNCRGW